MHTKRTERFVPSPLHLLDGLNDFLDILSIGDQNIILSLFCCLDHLFALLDSILELGFLAIDIFTFTFHGIGFREATFLSV